MDYGLWCILKEGWYSGTLSGYSVDYGVFSEKDGILEYSLGIPWIMVYSQGRMVFWNILWVLWGLWGILRVRW